LSNGSASTGGLLATHHALLLGVFAPAHYDQRYQDDAQQRAD
jgi:hypothetical protein